MSVTIWRRTLLRALAGLFIAAPLLAAGPTAKRQAAEELVREALVHGALGLDDERRSLLAEAEATAPEVASLRWAQGQVKVNDRWVDIDSAPSVLSGSPAQQKYERQRSEYGDTAAGQFALARWCLRQGLDAQAKAHLVRVLDHDTNHAPAREALGFVAVDGRWQHRDDISLARQTAETSRKNFNEWRKEIDALRHDMTARSSGQRANAAVRLAKIDDPTAIPALETLLCYGGSEVATPAVACLANMTAPESSLALARVATLAPSAEARQAAAQALRGRPFEQFVPHMLAALVTPVEARQEVVQDERGRILHRQLLVRETQDQRAQLLLATEYRRQFTGVGDVRFAAWQAGMDIAQQNNEVAARVMVENADTVARNWRITTALTAATDAKVENDPKAWWDWWNEYNDVKTEGQAKPVAQQVALRSVDVRDELPASGFNTAGPPRSGSPGPRRECLVAGTPVRTLAGTTAIERIRVGDMVLAQNIETGELAYKVVLKTTVTPRGPLVKIETGDAAPIRCTNGHVFWASGEGWRQARQLKSGMQLHTPRGTVLVSQVSAEPPAETYNLVVADFHSYFAGEHALLCHDNTLRRPTQVVVPGVK